MGSLAMSLQEFALLVTFDRKEAPVLLTRSKHKEKGPVAKCKAKNKTRG